MSIRASQQCIQKVRKALVQKGWVESKLLEIVTGKGKLSSQQRTKFFNREPIARSTADNIGLFLGLTWDDGDLEPVVRKGKSEQVSDSDTDKLEQEVRSRCCDKIQHFYSKIRLLNRQQIDIDKLYVDVYLLEKLSNEYQATIPALLKDYDPQQDRLGLGQRGKRSPGFELATRYDRLMVLGKPGSGKSTFLRHLAVACCKDQFQADHIPILIELRDINASKFNLLNHIHQEFDLADEEQTIQILKQGKVLILLDGLDEVPGQFRRDIQDHIHEFSQSQQHYKNRFILTCRTQTIDYISDKFEPVEVADFNSEQVELFAKNWFTTLAETPEQGTELTEKFLDKLRLPQNKPTAELAVTPILLSLTCWVFIDLKDLPTKRSDLYEQGINLLLKEWDKNRGVRRQVGNEIYRKLSIKEKKQLLSNLAARKFEQEQYVLFEQSEIEEYIAEYLNISTEDAEAVLEAIEAQHGLLIERAKGIYSFSHLTFQEYFAAEWFCDRSDWDCLAAHVGKKQWREVFLLAVGIVKSADELLWLMKEQIDAIVADDQFQQFLRWVKEKADSANVPYNRASVRVFYLSLALDIQYPIAAGDNGYFPISPQFARDLDHSFFAVMEPDLALDITLKLIHAVEREESSRGLAQSFLPSARPLYDTLSRSFNPELEESLQKLKEQLPHPSKHSKRFTEWWRANGQIWTNQLRAVMIKHRNIGYNWQQFSNEPKELLQQYYDANKLLVDCLNSGCEVSKTVKNKILERLLLPFDEINKRQQM
ncbi:MAG: NACHT domain-containing protein [Coleofasciculaceae cyanobacterium]